MKQRKGISLIVLVVTIIVMIIIAGAIIISLGNTNVIDQAENAATSYRVAQLEENLGIEVQNALLAKYGTTENVSISIKEILDIQDDEDERIVNIATANSIPANMPAGTYYKLDENRYATKTRENERELFLASRGIDRENELVTNTYVVNDNLDVYYIISGTIGEPEAEEIDWKYAWTSDGTVWSDTIKADELASGEKVEGKIVAKIYETDEVIDAFLFESENMELPSGKGYVLDIQGEGEMPEIDDGKKAYAWWQESIKYELSDDGYYDSEYLAEPVIAYITKVIIGEGITNIPECMMEYAPNLRELQISNTVTTIGDSAFWECINLNNVVMGENIETIESYAFTLCKNLEKILIPKKVVHIGKESFCQCENLKEIYIESTNSDMYIGGGTFSSVENATIYVRNETIANLLKMKIYGSTTISTDYNWVVPTN